jgi:hypothetical protein
MADPNDEEEVLFEFEDDDLTLQEVDLECDSVNPNNNNNNNNSVTMMTSFESSMESLVVGGTLKCMFFFFFSWRCSLELFVPLCLVDFREVFALVPE